MRGFIVVILTAILLMTLPVSAAGQTVTLPEEDWGNFEEAIPDEIKDMLPSDAWDGDEGFFASVEEMSSAEYIMGVILDVLGDKLGSTLKLMLIILALLLISSVFSAVGDGMENSSLSSAMRFCSVGAVISVVVSVQYSHFEMLEGFFEKLGTMMNGMVPVVAGIWAMGGNVSTASSGSATLYVMLTVSRALWSKTVIPVCCALTVLGFCDALSDEVKTSKIMSAVKKIYNFLLALVMTVLLSALSAQTTLAASADTTAARAAKLVSGTVIPVVGGSVGETFRTLAASVSYLKGVFGVGGIVMIAILVLPVLMSTLLTRFAFLVCAGIADMLGCQGEARLLENLGESYGILVAVVSGVGIMFVLSLCIFMQTVVAIA